MQIFTGLVSQGKAKWMVEIQDMPRGRSLIVLASTWKEAKTIAEACIENSLDLPPKSVVVELKFKDEELEALVDDVKRCRVAVRKAQSDLEASLSYAARRLTQDATFRDVAEMLDCSHQYIGKLAPRGSGEPS